MKRKTIDIITLGCYKNPVSYTHLDVYKRQVGYSAAVTPVQRGLYAVVLGLRF